MKKVGSKVVGAVKHGAGKVMHTLGNTKVGQVVKRGYERVTTTVNNGHKDRADKKNTGKTDDEIKKRKRLNCIMR
ncbi:MAG: hypothetical protein H0U76_02535 [Ktedonobacteraceae bacterium]|nr:hypothetical protein [Ktedonobacteraceae bacterium]